MKEKLIKCTIRTLNGLFIECELSQETIKELKCDYLVSVRKIK